eukprot:CAMPEP_0196659042 /NCGR_PEP_ID=MMETSP1086-20130531/32825_1 /TAXON_ID=77921 /ORGANISM="Cyanoptyche  gloeocystis , Strain SAG4.97" /LENGTH=365 /DNA_ID=CAMNT_0041992865 /DNA_START=48 /DNA_END=1145 /DNA_ORIENTATION=-
MIDQKCAFEINALRVSCPLQALGFEISPSSHNESLHVPYDEDAEFFTRKVRQTTLKFRVLPRARADNLASPKEPLLKPLGSAPGVTSRNRCIPPDEPYDVTLVAERTRPVRKGLAYFAALAKIRFSDSISFQILHGDKVMLTGNLRSQSSNPIDITGSKLSSKQNNSGSRPPTASVDHEPEATNRTPESGDVKLYIGGRMVWPAPEHTQPSRLDPIREDPDRPPDCEPSPTPPPTVSEPEHPTVSPQQDHQTAIWRQSAVFEDDEDLLDDAADLASEASDDQVDDCASEGSDEGSALGSSGEEVSCEGSSAGFSRHGSIGEAFRAGFGAGLGYGIGQGLVLGVGVGLGLSVGLLRRAITRLQWLA